MNACEGTLKLAMTLCGDGVNPLKGKQSKKKQTMMYIAMSVLNLPWWAGNTLHAMLLCMIISSFEPQALGGWPALPQHNSLRKQRFIMIGEG